MAITIKKKWLLASAAVAVFLAAALGGFAYINIYASNTALPAKSKVEYIYIKDNTSAEEVYQMLKPYLLSEPKFRYWANFKGYDKSVKPGRYAIKNGMSNNQLVGILRSGAQTPVRLTFNNVRTKADLAGKIGKYLECDSLCFLKVFNDPAVHQRYGYNAETFMSMFIPNTYEIYWNTKPEVFLERMKKEYSKFWTDERQSKAKAMGLSPLEVSVLASIVQSETVMQSDAKIIAGVYVNRLAKGMKLEADPTVKFGLGDPTLKRILFRHLEYDSPYNTYMYTGLPPGPICLPSITNLDATLNFEKHEYIFFVAREDFSGYSNFAKTLEQHNQNARRYQQALNSRGIY